LTCKLWNWGDIAPLPPWLRAWWQPHSDCRLQTSAGIRQVHVYTDSVVQINQHNFQQS